MNPQMKSMTHENTSSILQIVKILDYYYNICCNWFYEMMPRMTELRNKAYIILCNVQ